MATLEDKLQESQAALDAGDFERAQSLAAEALAVDGSSYTAHCLAGKAAFCLGDVARARAAYRQAITRDSFKLPAWEGMAELQMGTGDFTEAHQTFEQLLRLAMNSGDQLKQREYLWRNAEACDRLGEFDEAEEHLKSLLDLDLDQQQRLETLCFTADVQVKIEEARMERAIHQAMVAQERQHGRIVRSVSSVRLGVDASRADEQESEGGLADTLKSITKQTIPSPRYVRYHELHLQRFLSRLGAYPPRSQARQEKRLEALKECVKMITASAGGCCTAFPFEAAIWLLEEQEEIFGGQPPISRSTSFNTMSSPPSITPIGSFSGLPRSTSNGGLLSSISRGNSGIPSTRGGLGLGLGQALGSSGGSGSAPRQLNWYRGDSIRGVDREFIYKVMREQEDAESVASIETGVVNASDGQTTSRVEDFGRKLAHQFPWSPAAYVAVGLALRRRLMADPKAPSTVGKRRQITKCLKHGVELGADSAAGWKALAELQYQNRQFQEAYDTAVKGLEWSVKRRRAGHETLTSFALALRLVVAQCLRRLNRLDEAEYNFKILAGWVTEGESAFNEMSGSPPKSIRQQALRGIAKVALERGDTQAAKHQYERILGKALIGRGPPAEHWAHSEYAWLLFEGGDLDAAKQQLETALRSAERELMLITDTDLADVHYKLGRICWTMGGNMQTDPMQAKAHFEAASKVESDIQGVSFQWLGRWYEEVDQDYLQAQRCFEQAMALDPEDVIPVEALEKLRDQGKISLSPRKSGMLLDKIKARMAAGKEVNKNSTPIDRIRYEGALERALS